MILGKSETLICLSDGSINPIAIGSIGAISDTPVSKSLSTEKTL
jgi:hypothetical protein